MPRRVASRDARAFAIAVGKAIRVIRRTKGIKAVSLSMDSGIAEQSISNWETGKTAIELVTLYDVCRVLDVPVWQVIRSAENAIAMRDVLDREKAAREARLQELDEQEGL